MSLHNSQQLQDQSQTKNQNSIVVQEMSEFDSIPLINRTDRFTGGDKASSELTDPNDFARKHRT